jgi:hypothetical protein
MVFPHGRALRARLLSFPYIDGIYLRISWTYRRLGAARDKVVAGGAPANPATLDL